METGPSQAKPARLLDALGRGQDVFRQALGLADALPTSSEVPRGPLTVTEAQQLVQERLQAREQARLAKEKSGGYSQQHEFNGVKIGAGRELSPYWLLVEVSCQL